MIHYIDVEILSDLNLKRIRQSQTRRDMERLGCGSSLEAYKKDSGKRSGSVYGRLEWDKPANTITTKGSLESVMADLVI